MSVRPGFVQELVQAATLMVAAGAAFPLNNQFAAGLVGVFTYVASATVGNRTVQVRLLDSAANIMMVALAQTLITAGQTVTLILMPGQPFTSIAGPPITQILPWPMEMSAVPLSSLRVVDTSAISATDTVAGNITFAT